MTTLTRHFFTCYAAMEYARKLEPTHDVDVRQQRPAYFLVFVDSDTCNAMGYLIYSNLGA